MREAARISITLGLVAAVCIFDNGPARICLLIALLYAITIDRQPIT